MEQIRARFEDLNPYDPTTVTDDLLELEDENFADPKARTGRRELWCYGISAKRYVLYNHDDQDELVLRGWSQLDTADDIGEHEEPTEQLLKPSQHGLGHLLNPTDPASSSRGWIGDSWKLLLRAQPLLPDAGPDWLERPAVAQSTVSSPSLLDEKVSLHEQARLNAKDRNVRRATLEVGVRFSVNESIDAGERPALPPRYG